MISNIKRTYKLLNSNERKSFFFALLLTVLSGFFDSLSIGIILPLASIVFNEPNEFIKNLNINNWELLIVVIFIISISLSLIVRVFSIKRLNKFSWKLTKKFSNKILSDVLLKPVHEIEDMDSNNIKSAVTHKVYIFMVGFIVPIIRFLSATIFATMIFIVLIILDPMVFLATLIFIGVPYILVFSFIRRKNFKLGGVVADTETQLLKNLNEIFFDIRGIRSRSEELFLINLHGEYEKNLRSSQLEITFLRETPRYIIEAFILFLAAIGIYIFSLQTDVTLNLPLLAAYALGLQRALPHFQNMFASIQTISATKPSVDEIFNKYNDEPISEKYVELHKGLSNISINDITMTLSDQTLFHSFNYEFMNGKNYFISGESGCGKSTLLDLIAGFKKPDSGKIKISSSNENYFSFMSQRNFIYNTTLKQNIIGNDNKFNHERYEEVISISNLEEFRNNLELKDETIIGDGSRLISGGQIQRIALARSLYFKSNIYLLDEPFSALDNKTASDVCKQLLDFEKNSIKIIILHNKKILDDFNNVELINLSKID
ncbi:ABC transporter ATP-binding protein/permease [Gammaproteobacteria bacterium]|nr:ABC transporter ATP-binding protein/permease [Gammaproteobacteria bacterium]